MDDGIKNFFAEDLPDLPVPDLDVDLPEAELPDAAELDALGAQLAAAVPTPDLEVPDLEVPDLEVPDLGVPEIEVPEVHLAGGLEIPDLDLAGVGIGAPDVEIPDVEVHAGDVPELDASDLDLSDLDLSDLDIPDAGTPDLDLPDVGVPDVDIADLEDLAAETTAPTSTPFSPMLAATGLFGDSTSAEEAPLEIPEEPTDDLEALVDSLDDGSTPEIEPPDLPAEPIDFGDIPEADESLDIELGATTPPSVYSELEELSGELSDAPEPEMEAEPAADIAEGIDLDMDALAPDLDLEGEEPADRDLDADPLDLTGDETQGDDVSVDEAISMENPESDLGTEPDYGAVLGSGPTEHADVTEEATDLEPEDAALAALAALAAEVDPIVAGEEDTTDIVEESLSVDTDDWLAEDDLAPEEPGFDIGIKLGTGAVEEDIPAELETDGGDGVGLEGVAAAMGGAAALGLTADALGDADGPDLDMDVADVDVSDMEMPEIDVPDVDVPDAEVAEVEVAEFEVPEVEADEPVVSSPMAAAAIPEVDVFDEIGEDDSSAQPMVSDQPEAWGARWKESAEGWVEDDSGGSSWRPIVTTSPLLSEWDVDTYLGVVIGDSTLDVGSASGAAVAEARTASTRRMVNEALARGAHAVVGVSFTVQTIGGEVLVTASGTAVTLKADAPS